MNKKKLMAVTVAVLFCFAAVIIIFILSSFYRGHFEPGTKINTVDCSNLSACQANDKIQGIMKSYLLTVYYGETEIAQITADDMNLACPEKNKCQLKVLLASQNFLGWLSSLMSSGQDYFLLDIDEPKIERIISGWDILKEPVLVSPQNAYLQQSYDGFQIIPEAAGCKLDEKLVKETVIGAIRNFRTSCSLSGCTVPVPPSVFRTDDSLNQRRQSIDAILSANIACDFGDGRVEQVDRTVLAPMIVTEESQDVLDREKLLDMVYGWASKYDTFGQEHSFTNHDGIKINVGAGDYGWALNCGETADLLYDLILDGYTGKADVVYEYAAMSRGLDDIGGTYVEVSISEQMLWCYQDYQLVVETPVVTGLAVPERMTHTGCYAIDYKTEDAVLRGENYAEPVSYWMPFNGDEGIHDLPRSAYGGDIYLTNGSHGCVNTPLDAVKKVYDTVSAGTAVIVY